jgi:hypothetical protein
MHNAAAQNPESEVRTRGRGFVNLGLGVRTGLFSTSGAFCSAPPTGRGESIKCLRPAVSRGQGQRGKANTAGASVHPRVKVNADHVG